MEGGLKPDQNYAPGGVFGGIAAGLKENEEANKKSMRRDEATAKKKKGAAEGNL